jgi:hypothetical protein
LVIRAVGLIAERLDEAVEVPGGDEILHAVGHPLAEMPGHLDFPRWKATLRIRDHPDRTWLIHSAAQGRADGKRGSQGK